MTSPAGFAGEVFLEDLEGLDRTGFAVCAFLSAGDGYETYAQRLAASCRRFGLPHSIWRVPVVHCSISLRGAPDLRYTKPAFIAFCLDHLAGAAAAYLDVDTLLMATPAAFFDACRNGNDFAIYNWLGDPHNEAYLPTNHKIVSADPRSAFYVFSHRVEWSSSEQLICSGVTQLYANTSAARSLLADWQQTIAENPRAADDQCLNFAHNNRAPGAALRPLWLQKPYARSPWWPHVEPVVLHPAIPATDQPHVSVVETDERRCVHLERCSRNETPPIFPREGGVEVGSGTMFRLDDQGRPQPAGRYDGRFWIYPEDYSPPAIS